jgi:hypothetical protein
VRPDERATTGPSRRVVTDSHSVKCVAGDERTENAMSDDPRIELYERLAATGELPVDRTASRWLGEAEAVAADIRHVDDPAVVADRAGTVVELLAEVESTGHPDADEHVQEARELAAALAGR